MAKNDTTLKKVTVKKIKLSELAPGAHIEGTFKGFELGEPFLKNGEERRMLFANIIDDSGERIVASADKGFQGALKDAGIHEGNWFRAVKLEKQSISGGRTMNAYDVYTK